MEEREKLIQQLMGKTVHVVVDRPMGYRHGDLIYPVNYGYIPGILAGDGEEQDAYILGVSEPVTEFDGQVIAAIRRKDDIEDKLVVAPAGTVFDQGQIAEAVRFQEQYFDSSVDALFHRSCGVIPFRRKGQKREYLILLQKGGSWSFPKGHMEAGETEAQTALRELFEETGLRAKLLPGQRVVLEYDIPPCAKKQLILFPGEVYGAVKEQPSEILRHKWVTAEALRAYLHPETCAACAPFL